MAEQGRKLPASRLWQILEHVKQLRQASVPLFAQLTALYAAFGRGEAPRLPGLPIQYADFAVWQREWLQGSALEAQTAYWRRALEGAATLDLPLGTVKTYIHRARHELRKLLEHVREGYGPPSEEPA